MCFHYRTDRKNTVTTAKCGTYEKSSRLICNDFSQTKNNFSGFNNNNWSYGYTPLSNTSLLVINNNNLVKLETEINGNYTYCSENDTFI